MQLSPTKTRDIGTSNTLVQSGFRAKRIIFCYCQLDGFVEAQSKYLEPHLVGVVVVVCMFYVGVCSNASLFGTKDIAHHFVVQQ